MLQLTRLSGKVIYEHNEENNTWSKTIKAARDKGLPLNQLHLLDIDCDHLSIVGAIMRESTFENVVFKNVTLSRTDFSSCYFLNCTFLRCNFLGSQFRDVLMNECSVEQCNLQYATIERSITTSTSFRGSKFDFATFKDSSFHDIDFRFTTWNETKIFGNDVSEIASAYKTFHCL